MNKILLFFKYHGYESSSQISCRQLDNIIAFNTDPLEQQDPLKIIWKKEILEQAWKNSDPNEYQRVVISRYVRSLFDIHHQLNAEIREIKEEIQLLKLEVDQATMEMIQSHSSSLSHGGKGEQEAILQKHKITNLVYLINNYEEECVMLGYQENIILRQFQRSVLTKPTLDFDHQSSTQSHEQSIIQYGNRDNQEYRVYNDKLRVLFILACSFVLVEMFVMFLKYSYLDLLIGFLLLSIFLFSCFHHSYIKILLLFISCSFIFDIVWVLGKAHGYWFPNKFSVYSDIDPRLHRFILVFIVVQTFLKSAIGYYLWPWRKLETEDIYYVKGFGRCDFTLTRSQAKIKLQEKLIDQVFRGVIY